MGLEEEIRKRGGGGRIAVLYRGSGTSERKDGEREGRKFVRDNVGR